MLSADRFSINGEPISGRATLARVAKQERQRTPFGQRLYEARKHAKLTQTQLAKAAGLAQSTLGELEFQGDSSMRTVQIAEACGVRAQWLADGTGPMLDVRRMPPEVEQLVAEMLSLDQRQKAWVVMTLREAVKVAREMIVDQPAEAQQPSSYSTRRRAS